MAYGLRLRIEYLDINDILTRINIYQDGYTGVADVRSANAGITIEWGDQGAEGMPVVYGSSCTINFDAEFDYEFLYLFTEDAHKFKVEVAKVGVFWWGCIEPGQWTEPLIAPPYPVKCTAFDGLGFLKDSPFLDDNGELYIGKKTIFEVLRICLMKTGLDLNINVGIDWEEQLQTAGTDYTKVHKVNCDNFIDCSCYEVLEKLFPECRVFQRNGEWWVISNTNFYRESISYFTTFPDDQDLETGYVVCEAANFWFEGLPTMQMLPALKHLNLTQNYGLYANLILNGSFDVYKKELNQFVGWENIGIEVPVQRELNEDGDKYVLIHGKQFPENYGDVTYGMKKQLAIHESVSTVEIGLKYALVSYESNFGLGSCLMFIRVQIIGDSDSYYLKRKDFVEKEQEFEWALYDDETPVNADHITLGSHLVKSKASGHTNEYYNTFDNIAAYKFQDIPDHFENFKASVTGIPITGNLEVNLYVPYTDLPNISGAAYTGVTLKILDEEDEQYPETTAYKIKNNDRNNYVPEDVELTIGDYPDIANSDIMFKGGISRLNESHTTGWRQTGTTEYHTFAELVALIRAAYQRFPRQTYQVRIADIIPRLNMVIVDENNGSKRLFENGITYDDRMQAVDGRYVELSAYDFTGLTVESATKFDSKTGKAIGSSTSTIITAKPINAESRVTLIDPKGAAVSKPSYLDSEYFEADIIPAAEDDGFGRIQPGKGSISPYAMAPDAALPPFSIQGAIVETNVDDIANKVKINAGTVILHNLNAQTRRNIKELLEAEETYDPTEVFTIAETVETISDNDRRSVYLKIPIV